MNNDRIAAQAKHYKNLVFVKPSVRAVVRLEDKNDEDFWRAVLQRHTQDEFYFVSGTRGAQDDPTGSKECLRYLPYLNRRFWIAIDSDMRLLRNEPPAAHTPYVLQTYTYSWENHLCEPSHVQHLWAETAPVGAPPFDFQAFLHALSVSVYDAFGKLFDTPPSFTVLDLARCLDVQCNSPRRMNANGQSIQEEVNNNLLKLVSLSPSFSDHTEELCHKGVTADNVLLHLRGHNVYNLVQRIAHQLCYMAHSNGCTSRFLSAGIRILSVSPPQSACWQMQHLDQDIAWALGH